MLLGLIGAGIQRSLSPAMHEEEARHHGLRLRYDLIDLDEGGRSVAQLPQLLEDARRRGLAGVNITYPCKQQVIPLLDELSSEARAMQAVNTVLFREGKRIGHNTDGSGWRWGFERALPGADAGVVLLLGAGGAGSAIAHALMGLPVRELRVVDVEHQRAVALATALNGRYGDRAAAFPDGMSAVTEELTGIIHATPTGMDKQPGLPLEARMLRPTLWVSESVYFPMDTPLLQAAAAAGCPTMDGGAMAVGQAVGAFELFTGMRPDPQRMDRHFRRLTGG